MVLLPVSNRVPSARWRVWSDHSATANVVRDPPHDDDANAREPALPLAFLRELKTLQDVLATQNDSLTRLQQVIGATRAQDAGILDVVAIGHFVVSADGRIDEANETGARQLRCAADRLAGEPFAAFLARRDVAHFAELLAQVAQSGHPASTDLALQRRDGSTFNARTHLLRAVSLTDVPQVRIAVIDVSHQHELARARSENVELRAAMSRRMVLVQEEARRRLSGELHDRTSPNLAAIEINLDIIACGLPEEHSTELAERLDDTRGLIRDTASWIREICADLRPAVLDYAGLHAALHAYARQMSRRTGIPIDFESNAEAMRLETHVESLLFRIAQEALTNCARHAGATTASIRLQLSPPHVVLAIVDDGAGFDLPEVRQRTSIGLGLLNMGEMAEFAGGALTILSAPQQGTTITVEI